MRRLPLGGWLLVGVFAVTVLAWCSSSCTTLDNYTASDGLRLLIPNRFNAEYGRGEGDGTIGSGDPWRYDGENDWWAFGFEWDLLAQPVRIESFGQFRREVLTLPVSDPTNDEVLEVVLGIRDDVEAMEVEAEGMLTELKAIEEKVDAEAFIDQLWVKLGLGTGGLTLGALLLLLLRSKAKGLVPEPEEPKP